LGDTLVEYHGVPLSWQSEYPSALAALSARIGVRPTDAQLARSNDVLLRFNTRVTPRAHEVDDRELFGEVMAALGAVAPLAPQDFDDGVDAFFSVFRGAARVTPGAAETVSALMASGVRVGVLTDVAYAMPRRLVADDLARAGLGALAASTLTSSDVGRRKPDPAGFHVLAERLGASASEMVFVGNERKDVEGALAAGARAVLLWRDEMPAPPWGQQLTVPSLAGLEVALAEM
jgi:putative hydrolase of the HAD superfamily